MVDLIVTKGVKNDSISSEEVQEKIWEKMSTVVGQDKIIKSYWLKMTSKFYKEVKV